MLFPKVKEKKKRKRHPPSILHDKNSRTCYLCVMLHDDWSEHRVLQEHHVFRGKNRTKSEENGLKVYLCPQHHTIGPEAVHNNDQIRRDMEHMAQVEFEKRYGHTKFIELFGQNYPSFTEIGDAHGQEHKPVQGER